MPTPPGVWERTVCWVSPQSETCRSQQQGRIELDQQYQELAAQRQAEAGEQVSQVVWQMAPYGALFLGAVGIFFWYRRDRRRREEELFLIEQELRDA